MEDGTLKISDFGTAKSIKINSNEDIAKLCSSLKGTPYYMAPEILRRTGHNISADIWSLGCLVIEMISGKAPWTALTSNFEEIISYIVSGIHPPFPKTISNEC
jgi:serine/threonine protein kinase